MEGLVRIINIISSIGNYNNGKKVDLWTEYENFDIYDSEGISTVGLGNKTM
jgi:hypothetical protein